MKPKIIIIGDEPKEKKPIQFISVIDWDGNTLGKVIKRNYNEYKKITIIKVKSYSFDCLCICVDKKDSEFIFTANFNDGVLE